MIKFIPFLIGLFLVLPLGVPGVLATITEVKTECNLFDCYTDLKTDFTIDNKYLTENNYDTKELPNTELIKHIGNIKDFKIKFIDKNHMRVYGNINGASKNQWGLKLFDDTSFSGSTWWNSSYDKCINLTIDHNDIDTDLTNFPVMVKLNSSRINYALTQNDGEDIRFINQSCINAGYKLSYEIEKWNESGDSYIWAKIDNVPSATDRIISMYYNNSGALDNQNASDVWLEFTNVYHLTDTSDSTGVSDLTNYGADPILDCIAGGCYDFEAGDSDQMNTTVHAIENITGSVECWWYLESDTADIVTWYYGNRTTNYRMNFGYYNWGVNDDKLLMYGIDGAGTDDFLYSSGTVNLARWYHVTIVADGAWFKMYIDGVYDGASLSPHWFDSYINSYFMLGAKASSGGVLNYYDGKMDEVRIGPVRDVEWIKATYKSETDDLITYGSEQSQPGTTTTTVLPGFPDRYEYLDSIDYELWTYGAIVILFAIIFFVYI